MNRRIANDIDTLSLPRRVRIWRACAESLAVAAMLALAWGILAATP